jgi:hypothetical protein
MVYFETATGLFTPAELMAMVLMVSDAETVMGPV